MNGTQTTRTPLARLVLFMVCLAIAGSCIATSHYYAIDLPQQKETPPDNGIKFGKIKCGNCENNCKGKPDSYACLMECKLIC